MTADAACRGIRDQDADGPIGLVGEEAFAPYARPPLSKALWKGKEESSVWRGTEELGVELLVGRQVTSVDLDGRTATDDEIWNYSKVNDFTIISKDTDFRERSFVRGAPPKVIWLDVGNVGTGVDPIPWTVSERRIRCPRWRLMAAGDPGDSSVRSSEPKRSDWCSTKAKRSARWRVSSI